MASADFHLRLNPRLHLAHVFCLEEPRVVGNDWVVRYADRALRILPTARAKRHTGPRGRILVRESRTGDLLLVARTPEGKEHRLEWQVITPTTPHPNDHAPRPPAAVATPLAPAGFTRAGQPLSARQMAARARWSHAVTTHVAAKAARTNEPTRATS